MASKSPPSASVPPPAGLPPSGGGKYIVIAIALLGLVGAGVAWKMSQKPPAPEIVYVDAGMPVSTVGRNLEDEIPLPPPVEDASADAGKKVVTQGPSNTGCDVKQCSGGSTSELESALAFRAQQSRRRCYETALQTDSTLHGKVVVAVRIGPGGQVCSATVASNEMGNAAVASCAAGSFRGANFPAPKGGCVDVNVPLNYTQRQ
jgi:hypothetical protein